MTTSNEELESLIKKHEWRDLEFKAATNSYHFDDLVNYAAAIANEGGGKIVLGVTDKKPRRIVGTKAFIEIPRTEQGLKERLSLRIPAEEIAHPQGRVLIFHVPSHPMGQPVSSNGRYFMRSGDALVPMTSNMLKNILDETGPDFSAQPSTATMQDLLPSAIEEFRRRWIKRSGRNDLQSLSTEQLLTDAELLTDGKVTFAALILFGSRTALGRHLAQAEVIWEYRTNEASIPYQQRIEFRESFFAWYDSLWNSINARNDNQSVQDGLFVFEIPTFDEKAVREAYLNAVAHRDYRRAESVFIHQYPSLLRITSPGGFPDGITPENILDKQNPRNRRLGTNGWRGLTRMTSKFFRFWNKDFPFLPISVLV